MLNGSSVVDAFAEFAAHDAATLADGKEGMEAALAQDGEDVGQSELNRHRHPLPSTVV